MANSICTRRRTPLGSLLFWFFGICQLFLVKNPMVVGGSRDEQ